MSCALFQIILW